MIKKEMIKTINGDMKEITIKQMNGKEAANIFSKYINVTAKLEDDDVTKMMKDPDMLMHFINECFETSVSGVAIEELTLEEIQRISNKELQFMLGMISDQEAKN